MNGIRVAGFVAAALAGAAAGVAQAPAETCAAAATVSAFGYVVNGASTAGAVDDYDLAASGACAGGGTQVAGTGDGPDEVAHFRTWKSCSLSVNLFPFGGVDLALYLVRDCGSLAASCVRVADASAAGGGEVVNFTTQPLIDYWVIVDGSSGSAGGYGFNIVENPAGQDCVGIFADGFERGSPANWSGQTP